MDPGNTGRVGPTEAALFLKKSGLPDVTLGKVNTHWLHCLFSVVADGVSASSHKPEQVSSSHRPTAGGSELF